MAVAVSTFSWLATWLSPRAETIALPVAGLFHPAARPDIDLLPIDDQRYRLYWSEVRTWGATPEELRRLIDDTRPFERITPEALAARIPSVGTDGTSLVADAAGEMPTDPEAFLPLGTIPGQEPPKEKPSALLSALRNRLRRGGFS
ncbi:MAG: hypothetical protein IT534_11175 [Bauldia sp.]|nr:hypothetical protein [Bauldia sp.]